MENKNIMEEKKNAFYNCVKNIDFSEKEKQMRADIFFGKWDTLPGLCRDKYVGKIGNPKLNPPDSPNKWIANGYEDIKVFDKSGINISEEFKKQYETQEIKDKKTLLLILESPHKDEFDKEDGNDIAPANGDAGDNIRDYINNVLGDCSGYNLILMNAIPFQCSLGDPTNRFRNKVFNKVWEKDEIGKNFFKDRLSALLRYFSEQNLVLVNACTAVGHCKVCEAIHSGIKSLKKSKIIYMQTIHPSSYRSPRTWKEKYVKNTECCQSCRTIDNGLITYCQKLPPSSEITEVKDIK